MLSNHAVSVADLFIVFLSKRFCCFARSLHNGLPDERWGKVVTAFVKRRAGTTADDLNTYCRASTLANFKRPRSFVFVDELPKSPVGKLLRRLLVSGDYTPESGQTAAN